MMQPMNYTINTGNPGASFMQGAEQVASFANMQATVQAKQQEAAAMQAAAERKAYQQKRFQEAAMNPNGREVQKLMIEFPELSEQFKRSYDTLNDKEKDTATQVHFMVRSAVMEGKPEIAVQELDRMIEAAKNSGDALNMNRLEMERDLLVANPQAARFVANGFLASTMGPDKYTEMIGKEGEEERAQEKSPIEIRKLKAEAITADLEAQFAPDKIRAQIGLTKAQTGSAQASAASSFASAAASRATAARANAEANQINSGVIPQEKRPEAESKMREEYFKRTAVYQDTKDAYGRVLSANQDAAGDLALVFAYMKMLDPGSVVREGEFANASNAAGVPDRIRNQYNKLKTGTILNPEQRSEFKGQAKAIYNTALKQEDETRKGITRIAKGYGLNTENIFFTEQEQQPQAAQPAPQGVTVGTELPGGFVIKGIQPGTQR